MHREIRFASPIRHELLTQPSLLRSRPFVLAAGADKAPLTGRNSQASSSRPFAEVRRCKVLYLDFDGVLHNADVRWRPRVGAFMSAAGFALFEHASLLDELLRPYPDLAIVLSTSWVVQYGCAKSAKRLPSGLRERVVGATYHSEMDLRLFESLSRGRQVMTDVGRRRPDDWFALDDTDEGWPVESRERVIITHQQWGIAPSDAVSRIQANLHRMYPGENSPGLSSNNLSPEMRMSGHDTEVAIATVVGRSPDTPYVLVETAFGHQFMVNRKVFRGDLQALKQGDVLELVVLRSNTLSRVFAARLLE